MGAARVPSSSCVCNEIVFKRLAVLKKCLLIAPLEAHATVGRLAAIASTGFNLHVLDISGNPLRFNLDQYPFTEIKSYKYFRTKLSSKSRFRLFHGIVKRLRSFGLIPESRNVIRLLSEEIDRIDPSLIITYYGPVGIHYAKLVKKINKNMPVVSILNLIPSSLDYDNSLTGLILEKFNNELNDYKNTISKLDFLICASSEMKKYVSSEYSISESRIAVLPDYFPRTMTFKGMDDHSVQHDLSLVFLGAPERWGSRIDNIDEQLYKIALSGITIYSGKLADFVISTNNAFGYPLFRDEEVFSGELSTFAHQFDASLVTYGIDRRHKRFTTTLPTRFFSGLSAGIPIAVKAGLFDAVESYVERYEIGFSYRNYEDLKRKLQNEYAMKKYRLNAIEHCRDFFAEAQGADLENIFESVISNKKVYSL